jgi:hypothetical protein
MGNDLETEHLLFYAENGILANRQRKPTEDKAADFYWITLFFFGVLFLRWVCKCTKIIWIYRRKY